MKFFSKREPRIDTDALERQAEESLQLVKEQQPHVTRSRLGSTIVRVRTDLARTLKLRYVLGGPNDPRMAEPAKRLRMDRF